MNTILRLIKKTFEIWRDDNATLIGAGLAFYSLISLAPLLVTIILVTGFLFGEGFIQTQLTDQIQTLLGAEVTELIFDMIANEQNSNSNLLATIISIILLLYGATNVFVQLRKSLNNIWHIEREKSYPNIGVRFLNFVKRYVLSGIFIFGFSAIFVAIFFIDIAVTDFVASLELDFVWLDYVLIGIGFITSIIVLTVIFMLIFKYLPDIKIQFKDVWLGALVTAILFTLGQLLIELYLNTVPITSAYSAAGALAILLLWVYYSMQILIIGAEFTQVYSHEFGQPDDIGSLTEK